MSADRIIKKGVLLLFTVLISWIAFGLFYKSARIYFNGVKVKGTVDRIFTDKFKSRNRSSASEDRYPVIRFTTSDGKKIQFTSETPIFMDNYKVSDTVEVIYNKKDPGEVEINSFYVLWAFPLAAFSLAGLCLLGLLII
ncbi:MAG: DUF3592 domain-containing protein [Candidatus Riflebacteria bacterium]|nr:DUF3592 domain-containing protein [Candidatus Riflebacteria bacterium]